MCDLIDLNSPTVKGLLDPKLASPLIPAPNIGSNNNEEANSLVTTRRDSLGSNPFDTVLYKTTEYISKKNDPFEMMLQRALKFKSRKSTDLRMQLMDFKDDFTPKRRNKYLRRLNRTLDESLMKDEASLAKKISTMEIKKKNVSLNVNNTDKFCDNNVIENNKLVLKQKPEILNDNIESFELSILNQSEMNDLLFEANPKPKEDNEISILLETDTLRKFNFSASMNLKLPDSRRSLSQGDEKSPKKLLFLNRRTQSMDSKKASQDDNNSIQSLLDKGFRESKQSEQSIADLSNISSIAKLSTISLASTSLSSNGTMNQAFLDSGSFRPSIEKIDTAESSIKTSSVQNDLSDLTERFDKLKCILNQTTNTSNMTEESNESIYMKEDNNKQIKNDKLIDVDVFVPESTLKEFDKSTTSTSSSDSVFTATNNIELISNEAKIVAKIVEESEQEKTDSGSGVDDLISNNTLWMSELVPASEDEAITGNLIELPVSPNRCEQDNKNNDMKQSSTNIDDVKENSLKTECQFADLASIMRETSVTTLLLDLKMLVKAENNSEAYKLIQNLENVLCLKYKNNTELLSACLNTSNRLQTFDISDDKSNITEQSSKTSIDKSQEEKRKLFPNEKIYNDESQKLQSTTTTTISNTSKISPYKNNSEDHSNITNSSEVVLNTDANERNSHLNEILAELLVNLRKLINGPSADVTILQLLKNTGKIPDIVSNNCKLENELQTNSEIYNNQPITSVETKKSEHNNASEHNIASTKAVHECSFGSKSKLPEQSSRRSISVIHSPAKNISSTQERKDACKLKKRFSNDSGIINTLTNKKIVIPQNCNIKKETTKLEKKEKSLAVIDVKNKLKKKSDVFNKKGPMKALHPIGSMQKKGKCTAPSSQAITPPKPDKNISSGNKIISSTPNSVDNIPKKVMKSKPVASSTPDSQYSKVSNTQLVSANSCKKRNFSCDISPVTTYVNNNDNCESRNSPIRSNKLPTPKKYTPKHQQTDSSGIPKYCTPPRRHNSSLDMNRQPTLESPQYLNKSLTGHQRYSPVYSKRSTEKILQSPLKDSNKINTKVKPFKLISKFKRHSISDFAEKENRA